MRARVDKQSTALALFMRRATGDDNETEAEVKLREHVVYLFYFCNEIRK